MVPFVYIVETIADGRRLLTPAQFRDLQSPRRQEVFLRILFRFGRVEAFLVGNSYDPGAALRRERSASEFPL